MYRKKSFVLLISFLLFVVACDRIVNDTQSDEMARLQAWLQVNHITPDTITPSGIYFVNVHTGTGLSPVDSSYLVFAVTKSDLTETVYETNSKDEAELWGIFTYTKHYVPTFSQYLKSVKSNGLNEGLSMMKEGGKARLILPSNVAGMANNTTVIFDVELIKVVTDPKVFETDTLQNYLTVNPGFTPFSDSIYYKKITTGTRECIVAKDSIVQVNYTGRFLDGYVFDTNIDSVASANHIFSSSKDYGPLVFAVGSTSYIPGFSIAVKKMIEGEKAIFVIPSEFAYGASGNTSGSLIIQPYTSLIFEIELVKVSPSTKTQ
jgi:FKBP-type peptidyl-prolyl cis-trans isomerase